MEIQAFLTLLAANTDVRDDAPQTEKTFVLGIRANPTKMAESERYEVSTTSSTRAWVTVAASSPRFRKMVEKVRTPDMTHGHELWIALSETYAGDLQCE